MKTKEDFKKEFHSILNGMDDLEISKVYFYYRMGFNDGKIHLLNKQIKSLMETTNTYQS